MNKGCVVCFLSVFIVIGFGSICWGLYDMVRARGSKGWPTVVGQVTASLVTESQSEVWRLPLRVLG